MMEAQRLKEYEEVNEAAAAFKLGEVERGGTATIVIFANLLISSDERKKVQAVDRVSN